MRKTKIVCTIGPACDTREKLAALVGAGMNVARLNMSHATHEYHERIIRNIRAVSEDLDRPVGILMDLQGPRVRIGTLRDRVVLEPGQPYVLTTRDVPGDIHEVHVPFPDLPAIVKPGRQVLIDDGRIVLAVEEASGSDVHTKVVRGGELKDHKGINLPGTAFEAPSATPKDVDDLNFGLDQRVTMIAMSFVRTPRDVLHLRRIVEGRRAEIPIIAKVEKYEAVRSIDGIIDVVDGIMVARGDLGIEIPMAEVPIAQKMIIAKCNDRAIPVITATQILDSMIRNPMPTRAEATDVANAVFDGTDALMLSGETAIGDYPVEAVETMARIAEYAEASPYYRQAIAARAPRPSPSITESIAFATAEAVRGLKAQAIITATQSGYSARQVSRYRPEIPIYAVTSDPAVMDRLTLSWGIFPVLIGRPPDLDALIDEAVAACMKKGHVKNGDLVVIMAGVLAGIPGGTNVLKIHAVAKELARGTGIGRGIVKGTVRVVSKADDFGRIEKGDVVAIADADADRVADLGRAAAILSEEAGLTSYGAILGRELDIPVVVGIEGATSRLHDGMKVTIDPVRGVVYEGYINLPGDQPPP